MTKEDYQKVITDVGFTLSSLQALETSLAAASMSMDTELSLIEETFLSIDTAAQAKLDNLAQEEVMNSFLAEMKLVFDKYTAKMEIGSSGVGYGTNYGGNTPGAGIKFTATLNGVESTKEINKTLITSQDLV